MADIKRIKSNIGIMIDKGASEEEIDSYISQEGISLEQLRGSDKGIGFVKEHPIQSLFQPMAKTITGKSFQQMSLDSPIPADYPLEGEPKALYYPRAMITGMMRDIPAYAADTMTTPANLLTAGLAKIPMGKDVNLGDKILRSKPAQEFSKFLTKQRNPLKNIQRFTNTNTGNQFAKDVRSSFVNVKTEAVDKFSKQIDDLANKFPDKKVSLQDIVDDINVNMKDYPNEVKNVFRKTPVLRDLLNPKSGKSPELSLKEVQEITNYLNTKVPKSIRSNNIDLIDIINDIKASQLDAFPEMQSIRSDYAKVIEPYNNVKNQFRFNKLLNAIQNDFGGAEGKVAVESILPKSIIDEMGGYKRAYETLKHIRNVLPWMGLGAGASYVGGRLMQNATNAPTH